MKDQFWVYDFEHGDNEMFDTYKEAEDYLRDEIILGGDEGISEDATGSAIYRKVATVETPIIEKKSDYPCIKNPIHECFYGCYHEEQGHCKCEPWPYGDFEHTVEVKIVPCDYVSLRNKVLEDKLKDTVQKVVNLNKENNRLFAELNELSSRKAMISQLIENDTLQVKIKALEKENKRLDEEVIYELKEKLYCYGPASRDIEKLEEDLTEYKAALKIASFSDGECPADITGTCSMGYADDECPHIGNNKAPVGDCWAEHYLKEARKVNE